MDCRIGCGACCIAISISSPLPGMPDGKAAGVRCLHLRNDNTCAIHQTDFYPAVCANLKPGSDICGDTFAEAMRRLATLELLTKPESNF